MLSRGALLITLLVLLYSSPVSCNKISKVWVRQVDDTVCDRTPPDLVQSFTASCNRLLMNATTCTQVWTAFSGAFANRDPATVMNGDYINYFMVLSIEVDFNQSLFWSGIFELVELVSCMCSTGADVVSSTNTPSSEIINNIDNLRSWCGTTNDSAPDGIDYTNACLCSVSGSFWERFSIQFAMAAKRSVFYLGYGERPGGTFRLDSFFARFELPYLSPPRVSDVVVMVVHREGQGESCGEGTLITLKEEINARNLSYSCYDVFGDPTDQSQVQELSICTSKIITAVQQGMLPEPDDCFMTMGSGSDVASSSISKEKLAIMIISLMAAILSIFVI